MSYRPSKLGGYPHNEKPHYRGPPRLHRFHEHSNKENLYAVPHRPYLTSRGLRRGDSESDLPTTSTQVAGMEPVCFDKHLHERELFSTSSSLSEDELELSRKKRKERFSTHYSTSDLTTSDSSIGPSWITSNRRFQIPTFRHNPTVDSTNSLECSDNLRNEEFELENEDDDSDSDEDEEELLEKPKNKLGGPFGDLRRLESIEEMSPVLPMPNIQDDQDLPPQITPLRLLTSTGLSRFPSTNPYHQQPTTPLLTNRRMAFDQPRSLFELKPTRSEEFGLPSQMAKHFGIKGILFMTITMTTNFRSKTQLTVFLQHGTYFLQRYPEISTYATIEIKSNKRLKKRSKAIHSLPLYKSNLIRRTHQPDFNCEVAFQLTKENFSSHEKLGISVYATNGDDFGDSGPHELLGSMTFSLRRLIKKAKNSLDSHYRSEDSRVKVCDGGYFILGEKFGDSTNMPQDKIYHTKFYDFDTLSNNNKMIGESDWRRALNYKDSKLDPRRHSIQVGNSQRIPLNGRPTSSNQQQHFYPSTTQQYYLDGTNQEIPTKPEHRYGPFSALISGSPRKKVSLPMRTISTDQHQQRRKEQHISSESSSMMSKGGASSSNSSSSSSAGYKSHYRFTLPSITTTDNSECTNGSSNHLITDQSKKHVNQHLLYADAAPSTQSTAQISSKPVKTRSNTQKALPTASSHRFLTNQPSVSAADDKTTAPHHGTVRRVASFTYSTDEKHNKIGKKFNFAQISKIGNLIRGKADVNSTSTLYPSKEEVRLWQHSFDTLLSHKFGRHLFRQFVTREVSSENLDFFEDVEEFKKLKPGKKTAQKADHIYNTYFKDGAPKELNLDSSTKQSTLASYKTGCLPDTFNLAQSRIEQLMAKDSYSRFIQSKLYLDLLNSITPPPSATHTNAPSSIASAASIETSEPTTKTSPDEFTSPKSKSESPVNERPLPLNTE